MKTTLSVIILTLFLGINAIAQDKLITFEQLPATAQNTITKNFDKSTISYVKIDKDAVDFEYEIYFTNGTTIEFFKNGDLKKVDCEKQKVPDGLIPEKVRAYVKKSTPNAFITEWEKSRNGWKADLNNGLELRFNKQYQFVNIDD